MFYYLYEIKNNLNGKIYVGVHKTKKLNDNYMGSGKVILQAIQKHGIENFSKKILQFFENEEQMFQKEKEMVTEEFLSRNDVYNLRRGGSGGYDYINNSKISKFKDKKHSDKTKKILSEKRLNAIKSGQFVQPKHSLETRKKISEVKSGTKYKNKPKKSQEHKKKISESIKKYWENKKMQDRCL